jgi:thiol:disulfide interchange protein
MKQFVFSILITILFGSMLYAQPENPVKWTFEQKKSSDNEFELIFTASIKKGWHLYSDKLPEGGPISTAFNFSEAQGIELIGKPKSTSFPTKVFDKAFNMELEYFSNSATFIQKVRVKNSGKTEVIGYVEFMSCDDEQCTPPAEVDFKFIIDNVIESSPLEDVKTAIEAEAVVEISKQQENIEVDNLKSDQNNETKKKSVLLFILIAFLAGLAAVATPCVFPMIPMTVSFFMRGSGSRSGAIKTAFFFGGSIVFIFALLGALFTFNVFGANAGSILSTHWIPNLIFFLLFVVFSLSFLGLFELVLPGSLVNKTDAKAEKGGIVGAFFMALTTVIVSFSCTGPFIGSLIIEAVQNGGLVPLLGMTAFGLAFATPFTLLAIFPSAMKRLPKSGGWLNAIKVVFAFILIGMSLKFLNVVIHDFISREVFLGVWISLAVLLGFYFLGKIKFSHDSDVSHISVGRFFLALASFTFAFYLFSGLLGAPLKSVSSFVPAQTVIQMQTIPEANNQLNPMCGPAKYADKLHLPQGLNGYFDYKQGMECARKQNKPVFLVFKGHACANCKKMESSVWIDPVVFEKLRNEFVIIALYTDDRTTLPESEWLVSSVDGKMLKTMGRVNLDMLVSKYNKNSIPFHVIINPDGQEHFFDVTYDSNEFLEFLNKGEIIN